MIWWRQAVDAISVKHWEENLVHIELWFIFKKREKTGLSPTSGL